MSEAGEALGTPAGMECRTKSQWLQRASDTATDSAMSQRLESCNRSAVWIWHCSRGEKEAQNVFITKEKQGRKVRMKPILKVSVFVLGSLK